MLIFEENGKGFDPDIIGESGMGLRNMQMRAQLLGGVFNIDSSPGKGTTAVAEIPLAEDREEQAPAVEHDTPSA
jgi:signal transduction histidine kinase